MGLNTIWGSLTLRIEPLNDKDTNKLVQLLCPLRTNSTFGPRTDTTIWYSTLFLWRIVEWVNFKLLNACMSSCVYYKKKLKDRIYGKLFSCARDIKMTQSGYSGFREKKYDSIPISLQISPLLCAGNSWAISLAQCILILILLLGGSSHKRSQAVQHLGHSSLSLEFEALQQKANLIETLRR